MLKYHFDKMDVTKARQNGKKEMIPQVRLHVI